MSISKPNYYKIVANMMIQQYGIIKALIVAKDIISEQIDNNDDFSSMYSVHHEIYKIYCCGFCEA